MSDIDAINHLKEMTFNIRDDLRRHTTKKTFN